LAGCGAGLHGERSGTFWFFWALMKTLISENRAPLLIVLENVCGAITSHSGADFSAICDAFRNEGYRFGPVVLDAALFVPQSRARLFMIGVRNDLRISPNQQSSLAQIPWHTTALKSAYRALLPATQSAWIWWRLPVPPNRATTISDVVEQNPCSVAWHTAAETQTLLSKMDSANRLKLEAAQVKGCPVVGTIYKRTRLTNGGSKEQRAEVRFDNVAGCLRTPLGGSSRQILIAVDGNCVKSRLISSRETARLMGLPDDYILPLNYNDAFHLTGDGVVVPVVRYLAEHILEPVLLQNSHASKAVA
jgi:DNA (cytosine-5)-methyltransferase 1